MTTYSLELEIQGWESDNRTQEKVLDGSMFDLLWSTSNGISTVFTECETSNPVDACSLIAQRLLKAGVSITPVRWHDDFVGYSDLATNIGMTHEAVRLLATGKRGPGDFPKPRGYIGIAANRSPIWTWAEVSPWFNANYEIKNEEHFPSNDQIIEINARLSALRKKFQPKSFATI